MNTAQRIAKNTAALSIAELATSIINFFFFMYVARYLGTKGFGVLSFAFAFTAIFNVFTDIGLSQLTIREVARDKSQAKKYLGNLTVLKLILCIATFGLTTLTINLLDYPQETINVVYLIALSVVLNAFTLMFYSIFQAHERMEFVTIGQILQSALLLAGAFFATSRGLSVAFFAIAYLLASGVALIYGSIVSTWIFAKPKIEVDLVFWKEALKQAWPFGLTMGLAGIYYWISSVMLSLIQGDDAVGWYSVAHRLVVALLFIPGAFCKSIFPVMSKFFVSSPESLRFIFEKSINYMVILAFPIGLGTTLLAEKAIPLVFGAEYSPSIIALQILIWSTVLIFISAVFAELFNSVNRQIIVTIMTGNSAVINILLNVILIPRYSHIGASIAAVVTQSITLAIIFIWSWKTGYSISSKKLFAVMARVLIASAVMGVFIFYLRDILALWWLVPLSALLYLAMLYKIKGIDREDMLLLRQAGREGDWIAKLVKRKSF